MQRPRTLALPLFLVVASLAAQEPAELRADLQRLIAYVPGKATPTDTAVLAAEQALAKAMPRLVRKRGDIAGQLQRLCTGRAAALVPTLEAPVRDGDPLLARWCASTPNAC
jgi:hypothetical protein